MSKYGSDPYATIGLTENPFVVQALRADEQGRRLLVGREDEIMEVACRLHKKGKITCLDGHVGVGKTSLVNVAAFECFRDYFAGETSQLLIPSVVSFQLKPRGDVDDFCNEVFRGVAQTLLSHQEYLKGRDAENSQLPHIHAWLNAPLIEQLSAPSKIDPNGGVATMGLASDANNGSRQVNQSTGFERSGFEVAVRSTLDRIFTAGNEGGVVCVIDNIELLESGDAARKTLEALRDKLFNVNGLRWVFCGANGVIHSLAASPRLTAFLSSPIINVENVRSTSIIPLIRARLAEFSTDPQKVEEELPIDLEDLESLYRIVNTNLRDLLGLADDFCESCARSGKPIRIRSKKHDKYVEWLTKETSDRYDALSSRISQNAWAILDIAMSKIFRGTFGTADYTSFNQNSTVKIERSTFLKWLKELLKLELISKDLNEDLTDSDTDGLSRDVFSVTAKGALVYYARRKRRENYSVAPDQDWMQRVHY
ncbi:MULTISPECIES: hypothetical protein [Paraburkholderia]|uniref:hypothetical protein n=1 Tax=Paraburkholderia TaxID=1822464 RepID=UPI000399CB51|nr:MULTISPECIES: hypothetical protein [Paraburkholderia]MDH6146394.1 hypothetical protein [Paraburkholderia sp. WSM4179]